MEWAAISGAAGPGDQVPVRGDRSRLRSPGPGQQAHHGHRAPDRHHGLHRRALLGHHQEPPDRLRGLLQLRRLHRRRAQERRLGHDHLRGQGAQPVYLSYRTTRPRSSRGRDLGHLRLAHGRVAAQAPPGPAAAHRRGGPLRRGRLPLRGGDQRPAPGRRPLRGGHGDGLQEPQGGGGTRHPGRRQHQGPQALHGSSERGQEGAGGERGHRPGPAHLRHPGADERHQRDRRPAHPQHARGPVRGCADDLRRGHARAAQERRQAQSHHQRGCFGCTIACGRISTIDQGHFTVENKPEYWGNSGGLEYEAAWAWGRTRA